ncbi:N-acetylneuraminate synthase family protein [Chloroflexota bacterium]
MRIGDKTIGDGEPVFIIAEVAGSHDGDLKAAKKLVGVAAECAVDAIKFQVIRADELVVARHPKYQSFKKVEFRQDEWLELLDYTQKYDLIILVDVFDIPSLELMTRPEVKGYKVHLTNIADPSLLSAVAKTAKPVFLATGGAKREEIEAAIDVLRSNGGNNIILMHGYQGYPTKLEDVNLRKMSGLKDIFHLPVGFLDHVDAETDMAMIVPVVAIAWDAAAIEKHITLDRSLKGRDYYSSLNPDELKPLVENIRQIEKILGTDSFEFSPGEFKYRSEVMKNIVARMPIAKGTKISEEMLAFKRSEPGLPPTEAANLIGRIARVDIRKDECVIWDKVYKQGENGQ